MVGVGSIALRNAFVNELAPLIPNSPQLNLHSTCTQLARLIPFLFNYKGQTNLSSNRRDFDCSKAEHSRLPLCRHDRPLRRLWLSGNLISNCSQTASIARIAVDRIVHDDLGLAGFKSKQNITRFYRLAF